MSSSSDDDELYDEPYDDSLFDGQGPPAARPTRQERPPSEQYATPNPSEQYATPITIKATAPTEANYHDIQELKDGTMSMSMTMPRPKSNRGNSGRSGPVVTPNSYDYQEPTRSGAATNQSATSQPKQRYVNIQDEVADAQRPTANGYVNLGADGLSLARSVSTVPGDGGRPSGRYVNLNEDEVKASSMEAQATAGHSNLQMYSAVEPVKQDWYHGILSREESQELLIKNRVKDGLFLVRKSANAVNMYVVVVCLRKKIFHNRIEKAGCGNFAYRGMAADPSLGTILGTTISQLIGKLMKLGPKLAQPLREFVANGRL